MPEKLNLGCGTDIRPGWVNLDHIALEGVDTVHDVSSIPYPFPGAYFGEILCQDILEHLDNLPEVLFELKRILVPGGLLRIRVPHFSSRNNFADPTHRRMFSLITFEFFVEKTYDERHYYFPEHFAEVVSSRITFNRHPIYCWNYIVEPLVNLCHFSQNYYEMTGLSRLFPGLNLEVVLRK